MLVFLLLSNIFQLTGKVVSFRFPIHQTLKKNDAVATVVTTPYIHRALCSVPHSSQQDGKKEGWRDGGMEGWSPHYPLIAVPRSAKCLSLP
jgi:hypothetical protein